MKNYELKLQLQKQMEELNAKEQQDRKTVEQICADWGWTLSDKEAAIVNQIVINKGKVTAIEIAKEDNSTEQMLRETIRQMNHNMNDTLKQHEEETTKLKEQYEQQMLDMTSEFEYECECIAAKRDKRIKELEAQLASKDLLLNEFRESMDEKVKRIHELENDYIVVNNDLAQLEVSYELMKKDLSDKADKIDELELQLDELNRNYSALDSENEDLDKEIHILMGQNAALQTKLDNANTAPKFIYVEDDHSFDNEEETKEEKVEEVKNEGGDAVEDFSQYITVTIPDEYKDNNEIKDLIATRKASWEKHHRQQTLKSLNDGILAIIEKLEAEANVNLAPITKGKDVIGVVGTITIDGITYPCKYTKGHVLPMLAGCFNMAHIEKAKEMILSINQSIQPTEHAFKRQDNMFFDFDNNIVIFVEDDGSFKGYTDKEMFVWDSKKYPWPSCRPFARAFDENTKARSFKGRGKAAEERAFALMQYIRENIIKANDKKATQVTKESQVANDDYLETDDEDL